MEYKYHTRLNFGDIVIISTKENPQLFLPAKIEQIFETTVIDRDGSHSEYRSYQYSVRTISYEEKPFENFPHTDTNYLTWNELSYFETLDRWLENMKYLIGEVVTFEKK
jgi:hypothetical protein